MKGTSTRITRISLRQRSHHHHSSKKKTKRSKNRIHVSCESSENLPWNSQRSFIVKTIPLMSSIESHRVEKSRSDMNSSVDQSISKDKNLKKKKCFIQPVETNVTKDYHRRKRKNRRPGCVFYYACLLACVLMCIATAIFLGIFLSQKPITKATRSTNPTLRWRSTGVTIAGIAGVAGTNASLLRNPYGLAFDSSNTLYIVDYVNNRVQKLITGTSMTVTVAGSSNGTSGNSLNHLFLPVDILFDANDSMYITDRQNDRVQFWVKGATSGTTVAGLNGTFNISLDHPTAIVFGPNPNTLFIADTFNHRVVSYPNGTVVAGGNGQGNNSTTLNEPYGLIFDVISQSFIIPNYGANNIVRWTLGASNRTVIIGDPQGNFGNNSTLLRSPVGILMDPMGNIYVADSNNHRIQLFMAGQSTGITIAGNGTAGTGANQLRIPFWLLLDTQLNLYVSDTFNHRVQKFSRY